MKKLKEKLASSAAKFSAAVMNLKTKAAEKLSEDNGDTNFLSIIIILAIVLIVAIVFIAFKDKILGLVNDAWDRFKTAFDSQEGI